MPSLIEVSEAEFDSAVLSSALPVLADFTTPTGGPCIMLAAVLKDIAPEYEGEIKFVKINVEAFPALAKRYDILSVPTVLLMHGGNVHKRLLGNQGRSKLAEDLD